MAENHIKNIELGMSNLCGGACYCCSRNRGKLNIKLMSKQTFLNMRDQLREIKFERVHTSGCGDLFYNPNAIEYLKSLRQSFPNVIIDHYSNFEKITPEISKELINGKLINEMHISIDSVQRWTFEKCTGLDYDRCFNNMEYFLTHNNCIDVYINYRNPRRYWERCRDILGRPPLYGRLKGDDVNNLKNEYEDIKNYFNRISQREITYSNTAFSLWGERDDYDAEAIIDAKKLKRLFRDPPKPGQFKIYNDIQECCPKLEVIKNTIWIDCDGSVRLCPYDEMQGYLVYGNIYKNIILEIWNSPERKELLEKLESLKLLGEYPCVNPSLCCQA